MGVCTRRVHTPIPLQSLARIIKRCTPVLPALAVSAALLLSSCIGASMHITVHKDGSARADIEFRVAKEFAALGAIAGDTGEPVIPLTEEDFKNSVRGKEGVSLVSYRKKEDEKDYIYKARLSFKSMREAAAYLNSAQTGSASYTEQDGARVFTYFYWRSLPQAKAPRAETFALLGKALEGRVFDLRVTLPAAYSVSYTGKDGSPLSAAPASGTVTREGRTFAVSAPVAALFREREPRAFVLRW